MLGSLLPCEDDPVRPVPWSYHALFELYIFADRYDTLALCQQAMSLIQLKHGMEKARVCAWPSIEDISYAARNLPTTSALRKFLVGLISKDFKLSAFGRNKDYCAETLGDLPADFLAECLVSAKAERSAVGCKDAGCPIHAKGDVEDKANIHDFHEHEKGSKQVETACIVAWDFLIERYCQREDDDAAIRDRCELCGAYSLGPPRRCDYMAGMLMQLQLFFYMRSQGLMYA